MATSFHLLSVLSNLFRTGNMPDGALPVQPFDLDRYLGKWYEIARLDYYFERQLDNVTATYSLRPDGKIKVDNKGYNTAKNKWEESTGKAVSAGPPGAGMLRVSFFGPFYAPYNVIAIDPDYRHALVAGKSLDYLWLLSREKVMPDTIKQKYISQAHSLGYDTGKLIWDSHDRD